MSTQPAAGDAPDHATEPALADVVARLRRALRRAARAAVPEQPYSVAQLELLSAVAEHPGARAGDVAAALRLAPSTLSTLVQALERTGALRRDSGADRRTVVLALTDEGRRALEGWRGTNEQLLARALGGLPDVDRAALRAALPALDALVAAVDALADEA
ncbi:MAG TPA: MarR family winged helix-turn-helix transcriptional regulator [Motilibacteraceae bacterium]|nr:MarR family winged helix-turn-helix transcriptional regulator [Motilibacteraceae bacterium]